MPRFAANLTTMFTELPFLDRFDAAAAAGFRQVEFLFPYPHPVEALAERVRRADVVPVLFNLPPGDWAAGERGLAALPERAAEVRANFEMALPYLRALKMRRVHLMAGIAPHEEANRHAYREAVRWCARRLAEEGAELLLEPINGRDMPGYYLDSVDAAAALIEELGLPNLRLQLDLYHAQILHGDVTQRLRRLLPLVGHVQVASVPSRHEPDDEELNYPFLLAELDRLGYAGYVGCEYRPRGRTEDGLGWFAPYRAALEASA